MIFESLHLNIPLLLIKILKRETILWVACVSYFYNNANKIVRMAHYFKLLFYIWILDTILLHLMYSFECTESISAIWCSLRQICAVCLTSFIALPDEDRSNFQWVCLLPSRLLFEFSSNNALWSFNRIHDWAIFRWRK